jgi:hypothetical protein
MSARRLSIIVGWFITLVGSASGTGIKWGWVKVSAVDSVTGQPVSTALQVTDASGNSSQYRTDVLQMPVGKHDLAVSSPFYMTRSVSFRVAGKCTTHVRARLVPVQYGDSTLGVVCGLVTDSGFDTPIPRAWVTLNPGKRTAWTDWDGKFAIQSRIGNCTLAAARNPYYTETRDIVVSHGSIADANFALTYHNDAYETTLQWLYGFKPVLLKGSLYTRDSLSIRYNDSLKKVAFGTFRRGNGRFALRGLEFGVEGQLFYEYLVVDRGSCTIVHDNRFVSRGENLVVSNSLNRIELFRVGYDPVLKARVEEPADETTQDGLGLSLKLIYPGGKTDWF